MRGGILAFGIILLIFGLVLFFTGSNMVRQIEAYDFEVEGYNIPISELIKTLDSSTQRQYETAQQLIMFGSIFSIIGFILCIAGIAAPKNEEKIIENKHCYTPKSDRRCPGCGRIISDDADFCQYCGKKFGQISNLPGSKTYEKVKDLKEEKTDNQEPSTTDEEYGDSKHLEKNKDKLDEGESIKSYFCFECGKKLEGKTKFCPFCGTKQEES